MDFLTAYERIFFEPFNGDIKVTIGNQESRRECRFCKKLKSKSEFSHKAHAVPEFLGNNRLFSAIECNSCNKLFGKFESELAKSFGGARAVAGARGKKGPVKYRGEQLEIEYVNNKPEILIKDRSIFDECSKQGDTISFAKKFDAPFDFIPLQAAKALVKCACSICPEDNLELCQDAIEWLVGRLDVRFKKFTILRGIAEMAGSLSGGVVLFRRRIDLPIPDLFCAIGSETHQFQFWVPQFRKRVIPPTLSNPAPFFSETKLGIKWMREDWSSDSPLSRPGTINIKVEGHISDSSVE